MKLIPSLLFFLIVAHESFAQKDEWIIFKTDHPIVYDICFTRKGEALIVADGKHIKVFATDSQKLLHELTDGNSDEILTLDLSEDGTILVSGGKDSTLVIWDFVSKQVLESVHSHKGIVTSASISPDGRWIASGGTDDKVSLYDLQTNSVIHDFTDHGDDVTSVEFSPDARLLATASGDKTIKVYEVDNWTMVASLSGHRDWVRDLSFSADGKKLLSCGDDGRVITWDVTNPRQITPRTKERIAFNWLLSVDINLDNETYAVACVSGKAEIKGMYVKYSEPTHIPINRILFKPDQGEMLKVAVASRGKGVFMINAKDM